MFPIDWRLAADLCQRMLAAEDDSSITPAPAGRNCPRSTPTAFRRQAGAVLIHLGERLQGPARSAGVRSSLPDLDRSGERAVQS